VDDNCDGAVDESGAIGEITWYTDSDGDAYGDPTSSVTQCDAPAGAISTAGDCDDTSAESHPGAAELCDGEDNDCDGSSNDAGLVTWWSTAGVAKDYSATLAAGTAASPALIGDSNLANVKVSNGTLQICDGTWYASISLAKSTSDLVVRSVNGAAATTLTTASSAGGPSRAVVTVINATLELEGFTITDGNGYAGRAGGGIAVNRAASYGALPAVPTVTVIDSIITGNHTGYGGGIAVYNYAWVDLEDTVVTDNDATTAGGGFWLQNHGEVSCSASALGAAGFTANTALYGGAGYIASATDGLVDAVGCDWGDDPSGDDNTKYDMQQSPASTDHYCYANATALTDSVSCAAGSCTASRDTPCP
jgi:hypothetical protein